MPDSKVVSFPKRVNQPSEPDVNPTAPVATLFGCTLHGRGKVAFLDVEWLVEDSLLGIVTRNGVTGLLDLRPRPIFARPKFRHKKVVLYFYEHKVSYVEYAMLARETRRGIEPFCRRPEGTGALIVDLLARGLTICLFDREAKELGWVEDVRHVLRSTRSFSSELHPRSLAGLSK
jgi:hypothetical protein